MDRYRGPLIHAAYDLQSRIYSLVNNYAIKIYFIDNNGDGSEKNYFIKNTTFVIAQYFAWTEIIRNEVQFIEFNNVDYTKKLATLQDKIYSIWQGGSRNGISIWAGEQRGVGELMVEEISGRQQCIGYSTFLKLLDKKEEPLLLDLESRVSDYLESGKPYSEKLVLIQNALIDIIKFLDPENKRFNENYLKKCGLKNQ